ncbi:MAG TPA: sigma-54 dependent transcriptional regulator [bacterium]|nr:sigma-54 dependent transcriptional regulator [bacterium]
MHSVLFVDDEERLGRILTKAVETMSGWTAESVTSAEDALKRLEEFPFDVIVSDIRMPEMNGIELLDRVKKIRPQTEVVMMTAYGTVENAVSAMKLGAADFLVKPVKTHDLKRLLNRLFALASEGEPAAVTMEEEQSEFSFDSVIAKSASMRRVLEMARKVAAKNATVLLRGESGTGKDLLAQVIHYNSPRASHPFVKAVCAAIPEGLLESDLFGHIKGAFTGATEAKPGRFQLADTGTIFLDEIGDMTLNTQVKLLRVLQDRQFEPVGSTKTIGVDVRVIAATNRDLEEAIEESQFREDLYYRLNVVTLVLPPLRERPEDIPPLIDRLLSDSARREGRDLCRLTEGARSLLLRHPWPGNVRELQNALEHAEIMTGNDEITENELPLYLQARNPAPSPEAPSALLDGMTLEQMERRLIQKALEDSGGNATKAADMLGITRRTLGYRREKYQL